MAKVIKRTYSLISFLLLLQMVYRIFECSTVRLEIYNTHLGFKKYSFLKWLTLTILTFGLYHLYHEYKLTRDMYKTITGMNNGLEISIISGAVSAIGAWIFMDLYQQSILSGLKE
jgi:hypothetical protein